MHDLINIAHTTTTLAAILIRSDVKLQHSCANAFKMYNLQHTVQLTVFINQGKRLNSPKRPKSLRTEV